MKISKKSILQGFMIFKSVYSEFEKRMQNEKKGKETIQIWQEVFEEIDYDYKEANEDFIKAVKRKVANSKYVPTVAEIVEEMKMINKRRREDYKDKALWEVLDIEEKCELKSVNLEKAISIYCNLVEKYNREEIISKILKYREERLIPQNMFLNTEDMLERLRGEKWINLQK